MKYFFGFLASIGLIILVFLLVLRGLGGGGEAPTKPIYLPDYTFTTKAVQLTIDGRVNADTIHQGIRITVSRSESRIEVLQGYERAVTSAKSYPSNTAAYGTFLRALEILGYTKGDKNPNRKDERGVCPTGQRYIFEVTDGTDSLQRLWTTSCGGGTFDGEHTRIRSLFRAQIPDYGELTRSVKL